ncbi:kelch repeat and BTB domain-containing protein 6-like isoform X2 [Acanthaster planci]|nr:kelch repeat and BTB domain-containing protein 6-like isoform X2 [Acanthaster planci]
MVLASLSDFFPPLLQMDEKNSGEVTLKEFKPEEFSVLLKFAYTGRIDVTEETAQGVLLAADYLSIAPIRDFCENFMADHLDVGNVCQALTFSRDCSFAYLRAQAEEFFKGNLDGISQTSTFLELDPGTLVQIFDDDQLVLREQIILKTEEREKLVLIAVLRYLCQTPLLEDEVFERLLRTVRLTVLPEEVIKEVLKKFQSLQKSPIIQRYLKLYEKYVNVYEQKQDSSLRSNVGALAGDLPSSWFRSRKLAKCTVTDGERYAAGGQVAYFRQPPSRVYDDVNLEICKIDIWIRLWDGRQVIGGLQLTYHNPAVDGSQVQCMHGGSERFVAHHQVVLSPREVIMKVTLGSGFLVDRLGFETNFGRKLGPFGGPGGDAHMETAPPGTLSYLLDINCDSASTQGSLAILNLMLRWISFD